MDKTTFFQEKLNGQVKEHEVMRDHTTMHVGGVADFFYEAHSIADLVKAVKSAIEINIPYLIIGFGSNVIFSDYGFPGLIIHNLTNNVAFMAEKSQVIVDSGTPLQKLIVESVSRNLSGLEFLFGIPGTVGGAIYGNAGAEGQSIGNYVRQVTILDPGQEPEIQQFDHGWFDFVYRSSKLKELKSASKPIILSARLQLAQGRQEEIMRRLNDWKKRRLESQPNGFSAGSYFRNPTPQGFDLHGLAGRNVSSLPSERTAGYMLDKAGAKKMRLGGAKVSEKHAHFIINYNEASAQDVRRLAEQMRNAVKTKYDIELEEEVEYIGQW